MASSSCNLCGWVNDRERWWTVVRSFGGSQFPKQRGLHILL